MYVAMLRGYVCRDTVCCFCVWAASAHMCGVLSVSSGRFWFLVLAPCLLGFVCFPCVLSGTDHCVVVQWSLCFPLWLWCVVLACSIFCLKAPTSLNKESRPFFLSNSSIWWFLSVSSPKRLQHLEVLKAIFSLAIMAFRAFRFIVPKYYYRLGKSGPEYSRLLNLRRLRSSRFSTLASFFAFLPI